MIAGQLLPPCHLGSQEHHRSKDCVHAPCEGLGSERDAKGYDSKLEDLPLEPESQKPPVLLPDRDLKVCVLHFNGGKLIPFIDGLPYPLKFCISGAKDNSWGP